MIGSKCKKALPHPLQTCTQPASQHLKCGTQSLPDEKQRWKIAPVSCNHIAKTVLVVVECLCIQKCSAGKQELCSHYLRHLHRSCFLYLHCTQSSGVYTFSQISCSAISCQGFKVKLRLHLIFCWVPAKLTRD